MYLNFEPHSWYKGAAIKDYGKLTKDNSCNPRSYRWESYYENGNSYSIIEFEADTLKELKQQITGYINAQNKKMAENYARLEEVITHE